MARNSPIRQKRCELDEAKIKRAQKVLGTQTEVETIERALEEVISEHERQRRAWMATERFIKSGAVIKDVFGRLGEAEE
jgi:hypothetical protein